MRALAVVLLVAASAAAEEKPDTPEEAADKVLAAFEAKGDLKALAERDDPDPWLVADELCFRGEHDAAEAFAKAAPRRDTEKLPAYVASRRGTAPNLAARRAVAVPWEAIEEDAGSALAADKAVDATSDAAVSVEVLIRRGYALRRLRRFEESATTYLAAAGMAKRIGWLRREAGTLKESGLSAFLGSDWRGALVAWERRLPIEESLGNRTGEAKALGDIGMCHLRLGRIAEGLDYIERSLAKSEEAGDDREVARGLFNLGALHADVGKYAKGLEYLERARKKYQELGDDVTAAQTLTNIGLIHQRCGRYDSALECEERALRELTALENPLGEAAALGNLGSIHNELGNYAKALHYLERALALNKGLEDRLGTARTLGSLGNVHRGRGDFAQALACFEEALQRSRSLGDAFGEAIALGNIGIVRWHLGEFAGALDSMERARATYRKLGNDPMAASVLASIGIVHRDLGDFEKALECYEEARAQLEAAGNHTAAAGILGNIGGIYQGLGEYETALEYQQRARKKAEGVGDRVGAIQFLGNIGNTYASLGEYEKALDCQERALKEADGIGERVHAAFILLNLGNTRLDLGEHDKALQRYGQARDLAAELGLLDLEARSLLGLAKTRLALAQYREAARDARSGVDKLQLLSSGLAEEQGASARDDRSGLLHAGLVAGMRLDDPAEVSFFLESRAMTLLEALGGRDAMRDAVIPEELRKDETEARAAVVEAQGHHARALRGGKLEEIRTARAVLEEARDRMLDAVARIRRKEKAAAHLAYPVAAPLDEVRRHLGDGDAIVSYAMFQGQALALLATREAARIVPLGKSGPIESALSALSLHDRARDPAAAVEELRQEVIAPLDLPPATKRLLIAPAGKLAYVPFSLLAGDREIAYVPSGTAYGVLRDETAKRGDGVLALGNPDYGTGIDKADTVLRRGIELVPLPGSGKEASAVGDLVLLGNKASESGLPKALQGRSRWRAIHFACHGVVDTERPMLSSLALTADDENDGFLTTLEVFHLKIPADLVVLSACETGKGRIYRTEGVVGFTQAFLSAGAPRVIVSLWKVDDEATRALMVRFYELWKGGKVSTAGALRQGQEYVRDHPDHPEWRHPYYWAAWQLWGLPD